MTSQKQSEMAMETALDLQSLLWRYDNRVARLKALPKRTEMDAYDAIDLEVEIKQIGEAIIEKTRALADVVAGKPLPNERPTWLDLLIALEINETGGEE